MAKWSDQALIFTLTDPNISLYRLVINALGERMDGDALQAIISEADNPD